MSEAHSETLVLLLALWWTVRTVRARTDSLEFKASPTVDLFLAAAAAAAARRRAVRTCDIEARRRGRRPARRASVARARVITSSLARRGSYLR